MMECLPCKKTFTGLENYNKHLQSQEHKQKILSIEEKQNDLPDGTEAVVSSNSNSDESIKCYVCDSSFKTFESFQIHSETSEHALEVIKKQKVNESSNSVLTNHELNAMEYKKESTNKESILPELNKAQDFSYGKCDVCSKIFSGPEPYKQHLESLTHKKKVALQNSGGNRIYKCEPCNKCFSGEVPYTQHMCSEIHRKKLQQIQAMESFRREYSSDSQAGIKENITEKETLNRVYFCSVCKIECSGFIPYEQHLKGTAHFKNERRMQNQNSTNTSMTQLQTSKVSEPSENVTQIVNICCERENNSVFAEKIRELKIDELGELVKIISPDEEIKFDQLEESANEMSALTKQDKNQNDKISSTIKKVSENEFNDSLKKTEEENKYEVYETCKLCKVPLFDKESAVEHYESREHFEKRWGSKM